MYVDIGTIQMAPSQNHSKKNFNSTQKKGKKNQSSSIITKRFKSWWNEYIHNKYILYEIFYYMLPDVSSSMNRLSKKYPRFQKKEDKTSKKKTINLGLNR